MSGLHLTNEQAQERLERVIKFGFATKAARDEGVNEASIRKFIQQAKRKGWLEGEPGDYRKGKIEIGFELASRSVTYDSSGEVTRETLHEKPDRKPFILEDGYSIDKFTAQIDGNGNLIQKWVRPQRAIRSPEATAEIIRKAFENFKPSKPNIIIPRQSRSEMLTVYPIADLHLGMFAWGRETDGPDWDLSIARKEICSTFSEIVEHTPQSENAVFVGLGDILHSDNMDNRTTRSNNALDVDTRYSKVLETACDMLAEMSELVASKHRNVDVALKRGNHDDHSTFGMLHALRMYYRNHDRVTVDTNPSDFYWRRFGCNLIGGTHGDKQKMADLPMTMAQHRKEDWGETQSRHIFTGHVHHERVHEIGGVMCYSLRAPIPADAYHAPRYNSGRAMYAFNFHADKGSRGNAVVELH